jgi:hypothetical protein
VIKGKRSFDANVGRAGTIDIYKLFGATRSGSSPNNELTRGLIKFDLQDLKDDYAAGLVDPSSSKFACEFKLFDVYGGQTTPSDYSLVIYPLSQSFDEGIGRDVVFYQDKDTCNFLTASRSSVWFVSGANSKGTIGSSNLDVMLSGNFGSGAVALWRSQRFPLGSEDLSIDITELVSGTLVGLLSDHGYRISFSDEDESDQKTRFVKRFASKESSDPMKHPQLVVRYDDSVRSDINDFVFDYEGTIFLHNKVHGTLRNIISASSTITGSNCLIMKLVTPISGGTFTLAFTGSQHTFAGNPVIGTYSSSFTLSSTNVTLRQKIIESGSVTFDLIWGSLDGTIGYITSSDGLTVSMPDRDGRAVGPTKYFVVATNVAAEYKQTDTARVRVHIENVDNPYVKLVKQPYVTPSVIPDNVYYSIRESTFGTVIVPFDDIYDSTRLSSDSASLWFDFPMSNLYIGRLYEIDVMIVENGSKRYYRSITAPFKITSVI